MKLSIATETGNLINVDVADDAPIENIKAMIEIELQLPTAQQELFLNGTQLANNRSLSESGVVDGDVLLVRRGKVPRHNTTQGSPGGNPHETAARLSNFFQRNNVGTSGGAAAAGAAPNAQDPAAVLRSRLGAFFQRGGSAAPAAQPQVPSILEMTPEQLIFTAKTDAALMDTIISNNQPLADAILTDDHEYIKRFQESKRRQIEKDREREAAFAANPYDPRLQAEMEEEIRRGNVEANLNLAMEANPEVFASVTMLYIDVKVNKTPLKAFIDSGAQMTIMSKACAERCGIMRLVDTRFAGLARGVGSAKIIGKVHAAELEINGEYFVSSFTILEGQDVDFLFGLDMLRRHQCEIDLYDNCLVIGSNRVPFLAEKDIPKKGVGFGSGKQEESQGEEGPAPMS